MTPTHRSSPWWTWLLPGVALAVGVLGAIAAWLAVFMVTKWPAPWFALLAAADMALMLRLGGAPAGHARAWLAVLGTAVAIAGAAWMIAATQMTAFFALSPLESAQRLGPVLAGELLRHATDGWGRALVLLSLPLAWRLAR